MIADEDSKEDETAALLKELMNLTTQRNSFRKTFECFDQGSQPMLDADLDTQEKALASTGIIEELMLLASSSLPFVFKRTSQDADHALENL
jgi:hypothetical protein